MKKYIQVSLLFAAAVYLFSGLGLMLAPKAGHQLMSMGPYDGTLVSMFVAALFGFVVVFLIAAHEPVRQMVLAAAVGMGLVAMVMAYQMFINKAVPLGPVTVGAFIVNTGVAIYLFIFMHEALAGIGGSGRHRAHRRKPAKRRRRA